MCSDQDHTELMVLVSSHSLIASSYLNRGCLSCTYLLGIESGNESNNSLTRLQNADAICMCFFCICSIADSRKDRYVAWSRIVDTSKSIFTNSRQIGWNSIDGGFKSAQDSSWLNQIQQYKTTQVSLHRKTVRDVISGDLDLSYIHIRISM